MIFNNSIIFKLNFVSIKLQMNLSLNLLLSVDNNSWNVRWKTADHNRTMQSKEWKKNLTIWVCIYEAQNFYFQTDEFSKWLSFEAIQIIHDILWDDKILCF
jgi:hypothetical protein